MLLEGLPMFLRRYVTARVPLAATAVLSCAFLLAGCDEHVRIIRDRDVHFPKHATWAWRPMEQQSSRGRGSRPVVSRDEITRRDTVTRDTEADNDALRGKVKTVIEATLRDKGFKEVSDPRDADFLVDFHLGVQRRNVTLERVYPGAYPGLVCGPFGCYEGWGWGPAAVGYEHIRFREGTIVLDVVQRWTDHPAYRAIGEKPVHRDAFSVSQDEVNSLVHHLLKDLRTGK
jgi:hypothetical protein